MRGKYPLFATLAQMEVIGARTMEDVEKNTDTILRFIDQAVTGFPQTDIIVFPECCFQGSSYSLIDLGLTLDSEPIRKVQQACKDYAVWSVVCPFLVDENGDLENAAIVINDKGEIVHKYVKMCPWIPWEKTVPGKRCDVFEGPKGARMAVLICSDSHDIDLWREAREKGANVIIHPAHWMNDTTETWKLTNRSGAYLFGCFVLASNCVGIDDEYTMVGHSMFVSPKGEVLSEGSDNTECLLPLAIWPEDADEIRLQSIGRDWIWASENRGASSMTMAGKGLPSKYKYVET